MGWRWSRANSSPGCAPTTSAVTPSNSRSSSTSSAGNARTSWRRCLRRKIHDSWIEQALAHPARIESDVEDECLVHVLYPVPERAFRVLRVIYNETVDPVAIVTAYFNDEVHDL